MTTLTELQPGLTMEWEAASVETVIIDGRAEQLWTYHRNVTGVWQVRRATGMTAYFPSLNASRAYSYDWDQHHEALAHPAPPWPDLMYLRLTTLLTIATGRLLVHDMAHLHFALEHLVRGPVMAGMCSQIPSALLAVRPHVLSRLPWLKGQEFVPPPADDDPNPLRHWLWSAERQAGYAHRIDPAPIETWTPSDILVDIGNSYDPRAGLFRVTRP